MYLIIWQYDVRPCALAAFESTYAADGAWAKLFRSDENYIGTSLLRDCSVPGRYVTIDRWKSASAFEQFKICFNEQYKELDQRCSTLTEQERQLGTFEMK